jgi:tetratricopeptide (TPR) repeat protein
LRKAAFHSIVGLALLGLASPMLAQVGHDLGSRDTRTPAAGKLLSEAQTADGKARAADPGHGDHADHAAVDGHSHDDNTVPKVPTLLKGYGNGGFGVSTSVPQAQAFFSNGMELGAAFAHKAAIAAMGEAVKLDPACAMCLWGLALVSGPTINYGSEPKERAQLLVLARKAKALAAKALPGAGTPRERDLIDALLVRYLPGKDVHARDVAYAAAMQTVAARYPADNEIAVLTADALMVSAFVEDADEFDHEAIDAAIALLEQVLERAPEHTPAIHFYIHATEVSGEPARAERFADRLADLAPNASHLVHMPSHTFFWVGRYQDAADTNWRAVEIGKANARRLGMPEPKGVWDLPYHAHNVIFGLGGAMMAGDSRTALNLARPLVERSAARDEAEPFSQMLAAAGYFAMARFDDPAAVLALAEPNLPYLKAARRYARGEAMVWLRDLAGAKAELAAIPAQVAKKGKDGTIDRDAHAPEQMLGITRGVLKGRIAMAEGRYKDAAKAFTTAADIEETKDFMQFSDPPAFWYPVRRDVAAALLAAGDAAGARAAAEEALRLRPRDAVAEDVLRRAEGMIPSAH